MHINTNSSGVLIDVRSSEEFSKGTIGSAINIPLNDPHFLDKMQQVHRDAKDSIVLFCLAGSRSAKATELLKANQINDFLEYRGGYMEWEQKSTTELSSKMTLEDYQLVLNTHDVVLVDFYATWCLPCKKIGPSIDEIEREYVGKITVLKLDIDQYKGLAKELGIISVPHVTLHQKGNILFTAKEVFEKSTLTDILNHAL